MKGSNGLHRFYHMIFWKALPAAFAIAACALLIPRSSTPNDRAPNPSNPKGSTGRHSPIEISPDPLSLGTLHPGQSATVRMILHNSGPRSVIVERVETSCPCLQVEDRSIDLPSGESAPLTLVFDSSDEPDFRGALSIEVSGRDTDRRILFHTHVDVEVRPVPANAPRHGQERN